MIGVPTCWSNPEASRRRAFRCRSRSPSINSLGGPATTESCLHFWLSCRRLSQGPPRRLDLGRPFNATAHREPVPAHSDRDQRAELDHSPGRDVEEVAGVGGEAGQGEEQIVLPAVAGPVAELDDALGLSVMAGRRASQTPAPAGTAAMLWSGCFVNPLFGRLAGYEVVNDAERLRHDSAMRWIVGAKAASRPSEHANS